MDRAFGRYRIVGELGRGAMGAVYRATDPLIGREVAIKTLLPNLPEDVMLEVRERFLREARSAGSLNHPNIVTIFDVGEQDGTAYIAMELLGGRSLQQILREPEPLPLDTAAELAAQVADALDHAHQRSIVHRDVKPANVMVDSSGRGKLTDFGVAYVPSSTITQAGTALGSPRYMSPEHVLGQQGDPRSDIFSLGVMLYEMLVRRTPFDRPDDISVYALLERIAGEPHVPVCAIDERIPAAFDRILQRALAKKPADRYQRASDLARDLREYRDLAPPAADRYEKTVALPVRPATQPEMPQRLLEDIAVFERDFERDQEARQRAAEQERLMQEKEQRLREDAAEQLRAEQARAARAAAQNAPAQRRSAIQMLRHIASVRPPQQDKAISRVKAVAALDQGMRAAARYFAEFASEINSLGPSTACPYDYLFLGRMPSVSLSDAWSDSRPRSVDGRDCCHDVMFRYRIRPHAPASVVLLKDDISRCEDYLKAMQAAFQARIAATNDFGHTTRALITVSGGLLCELHLEADYDALAVTLELKNLRRAGNFKCALKIEELEQLPDDIGRYVLGADDEFEKRVRRER
ncbi:MAG: hypothetical protein A2Z64_12810 [Betaproteobacteria bacterium RIFCSPLOWO2_02_67_12]|nr:MAG: hypothetical protein A2Z64_12810 [Betaproteobacteria bacterium RIFCSPLOWO2_02_67_12]